MNVVGCLNAGWKIKLLIANCATWQTVLGTYDPMVHTVLNAIEDQEQTIPFPRCIINDTSEGGSITFTRNELGTFNRLVEIIATFEYQIPDDPQIISIEDQNNWVLNTTGAILGDINDLVAPPLGVIGGENPINLTGYSVIEGPNQVSFEELDQAQMLPQNTNRHLPVWFHTVQFTSGP